MRGCQICSLQGSDCTLNPPCQYVQPRINTSSEQEHAMQVDHADQSITPPPKQAPKTGRTPGVQSPARRRQGGRQADAAPRQGKEAEPGSEADGDVFPYRRQRQVL